jgi:hypothetical protein
VNKQPASGEPAESTRPGEEKITAIRRSFSKEMVEQNNLERQNSLTRQNST